MATYPGQVQRTGPSLSIGAVLARAFAAIGTAPALFFAIGALFGGGPSLAYRLAIGNLFTPDRIAEFPRLWPYFAGGGLAWWLVYMIGQAMLFALTAAAATGRRIGLGELLGATARALPAFAVLSLLWTIAVSLATTLLFLPGIFLWLIWAVAGPALVIERTGPIGAFARSGRLTGGARWPILAIAMLVVVIYWVASSVVGIGTIAAGGFTAATAQTGATYTVMSVVSGLLQMTFLTIWSAIKTALFLELRELKEGPAGERLAGIFA